MSFKESVVNTFNKSKDSLVKASPDILVVAGVIGFVGAAVLACRATLKAKKVVDEAKENLEKIEEAKDTSTENEYTDEEVKKDKLTAYSKAAVGFAKLYGPAVLLGIASAGMIFKSHGVMKHRLQITASALAVTEQLFEKYRQNVIDKYGEDEDKNLMYNFQKKQVQVKGEEEDTKKVDEVLTSPTADISPLCVFWGPDYNRFVPKNNNLAVAQLQGIQNELNNRLTAPYGKIYIRDILIRLGYEDDYVNGNPLYALYGYKHGDYIDFDITNGVVPGNADFVMGRTDTCLINFRGAHRLIDFA